MRPDWTQDSGAIFSPCRRYRYLLWYRIDAPLTRKPTPTNVLGFCLVNPSKADGKGKTDPTATKCIGFGSRLGADAVLIANPFAFVATEIADLWAAQIAGEDIVGPENAEALTALLTECRTVVAGWGPKPRVKRAANDFRLKAQLSGVQLHTVKLAKDGSPYHPLMAPYVTELLRWPPDSTPTDSRKEPADGG
jgi:hypothetical protein